MAKTQELAILAYDCYGLLIPSGERVPLKEGSEVMITQALGYSYTVYIQGNLVRIEGKDAAVLGKTSKSYPVEQANFEQATLEEKANQQLKTCYDPEIPVNIVDLGLIYQCEFIEADASHYKIKVQMTLTAPGCGMGPVLMIDVKQALLAIPEVSEVEVELVFDPPWDRSRMSEAAQLELGLFY